MTDLAQLQTITLGALDICKAEGFYEFHRFTPSQEEAYAQRGYLSRAQSAACVKLEFYTRGGGISFVYTISPGNARPYYAIDLLVDGVFRYHVSEETNVASGTFSYTVSPSDNEQRVTMYFPTTAVIRIKDLVLPADAAPHRRTKKILMLGDSMYQGYNPNHFQNTCINVLSDAFHGQLLNQSVGGECFRADNLQPLSFDPDFILVGYGINDWASRHLGNGGNAAAYFARLTELYPCKPIFAILPPDIRYLQETRENDDLMYHSAEEAGGDQTFEDIRQILRQVTAPYTNITPINARDFIPQYPECFYPDHVHLTDLGNILLGNALTDALRPFVKLKTTQQFGGEFAATPSTR